MKSTTATLIRKTPEDSTGARSPLWSSGTDLRCSSSSLAPHHLDSLASHTAKSNRRARCLLDVRAGGLRQKRARICSRACTALGGMMGDGHDSAEAQIARKPRTAPLYSIGRSSKKNVYRHEERSASVRRARAHCWPVRQPCPSCSMEGCLRETR